MHNQHDCAKQTNANLKISVTKINLIANAC